MDHSVDVFCYCDSFRVITPSYSLNESTVGYAESATSQDGRGKLYEQ